MTTAARADREVIRAAAAAIRHIAAQDQYRNGQYPYRGVQHGSRA